MDHLAFVITKTSDKEWVFHARTHDFHMAAKTEVIHVQRSSFDSVHYSCKDLKVNFDSFFLISK